MVSATLEALPGVASEIAQVAARLRQSLVMVRGQWNGSGSGVIWRPDGIILTNDHVARRDRARVSLADGRTLDARVIGRDKTLDLAAMKVEAGDLPAAVLGDSRRMAVGQLVLAVGNPLGVEGATTLGIISAIGRTMRGGRELVEADIDVYPGNSGGPLADAQGRVLGLTSMILTPGVALAVPTHVAQVALAQWLGESTRKSSLGVRGWAIPLPAAWAERVGQPTGVMLGEVLPSSMAEESGLLVGDIIVGLDGAPVADGEDLQRLLHATAETPTVRVVRGGEILTLGESAGHI
ncbi:MAG: trypsin-like peptidase domain-containing protein [Anaerolineae bacterium]